jgi:nucleoside-diphosphate-sugar epimerase
MDPIHLPKRPGEVMRFAADISLAKKSLGFTPKNDIKKGIAKYVRWFIKEGTSSR